LASEKTNLNNLIQQERFTEADALLTDMELHGPQPDLRTQLNQAKAAHEAAVTKTLGDIDALQSAGNEEGAYKAAVTAAAKDKIEPRFEIKVATLESSMPSTYDRVSTRIKAMNAMLAAQPDLGQNDDFNRLLNIYQKNLAKHEDLRNQMAALKKEVNSFESRIDSLRSDQKHNQQKANGYNILKAVGVGGFFSSLSQGGSGGAAGAGASATAATIGSDGANARQADVRRAQAEIGDLENQESAKQAELDTVRQEYATLEKSPINAVQ
jgi:chromosome segregation ATPase